MHTHSTPGALVRELSRLFVRSQRAQSSCVDGASNVQCHVLTELLRIDGLTQQALVERLSLDKAWISRAVDALVSDGVVAKRPHEDDKRSVKLSLTALGRLRAEKLENTLNAHAAQVFEHIAVDQHAQIHDALAVLVSALTQAAQAALSNTAGDSAAEIKAACHIDTLVFENASMLDVPAIEALLVQANLSIVGVRRHIAHFRLGKLGGKIVAVGGLEIYGEQALLRSIAVDTEQRNKGYGKQIVRDVCHSAQLAGIRDVYLKTVSASAFFDGLGFEVQAFEQIPKSVKKSSQFRGACPASATVMHLTLPASVH
ncbi:MAG: arsenic resistance N-acetyltransferase ArsN2 [Undibacterium sp.]|nr:arsenic resistance N-acetyltransferase ArsN2 [Undibacterium sp.]